MKKEEFFNNLCQIAEMIALTFGPGCETVIHDCDDYDRFIAEIWNGHVSGRKKGDRIYITGAPVTEIQFPHIDPGTSYMNTKVVTRGGRTIKSSTIYFRGEDYHYGLGINFDITSFEGLRQMLDGLVSTGSPLTDELTSRQGLSRIMSECLEAVGKPAGGLGRSERAAVVRLLRDRGVFRMQKAVPYVAERLGVSRYTIYNYLKEME